MPASQNFPWNFSSLNKHLQTSTSDVESQLPAQHSDKFLYNPTSFLQRVAVGFRLKNKLESSKLVRVPFNVAYRYSLIILLLLVGAFLTPQLLPRWLGFEWASPRDLCQYRERKLTTIRHKLENITRFKDAQHFLNKHQFDLNCMNRSAQQFYYGADKQPPRFLWPHECTSDIAQVSLTETTCVKQEIDICDEAGGVAGFFVNVFGKCKKKVGPDLCTESTDMDRANALLELERKKIALASQNTSDVQEQPIVATANVKVQQMFSRLLTQVDIAADFFILYSIISIAVGMPLLIYKREKGSRIIGAALGRTKISFIVIFIIVLSFYDSMLLIFRETDFARMFQNFLTDPCYVDPEFSHARVSLIVNICNNISDINTHSDRLLQRMDAVYYDTRLFGFCKDELRNAHVHPQLSAMDTLRTQYRFGTISNPAMCNATELNEATSIAPNNQKVSKWKALIGSGIVAQLLLKFLLTSWLVHLFAFIEPMILHNGKVEIWGAHTDVTLTEEEQRAATRFARDKHLLPLLILSFLLLIQVVILVYSIIITLGGEGLLIEEASPEQPSQLDFVCSIQ